MSGSDIASRMYPSMAPRAQEPAPAAAATPAPAAPVKAAQAAPADTDRAMADRLYNTEAKQPEKAWFDEPSTEPREPPPPEEETLAQRMYGDTATVNGHVEWAEDAVADVAHYDLAEMPVELRNPDAAAYAAGQAQFREGLLAAGAGPSLARELWDDAIRAERNPIETSVADATAELRNRWGPKAEAKVAAARDLLGKAIAKCPEIKTALERTGLGNDVNFIVKLSKRAEALAKKAAR